MEQKPTTKFSDPWFSEPGFLYFIGAGSGPVAVKIGVAKQSRMAKRLKEIQSSNHEQIQLLGIIRFEDGEKPLRDAERAERALHKRFESLQRLKDGSVGYEWFTASPDLLDYIARNATPPETADLPRTLATLSEK